MSMATEVLVPDIGDFSDVPIIEVHVAPGDKVNAEDPLLTLESDKATLDVPAPSAGTVGEVLVKVGDEVSEGTPILMLSSGDGASHHSPVAGGAAGAGARTGRGEGGGRGGRGAAGGAARGGGAGREHGTGGGARRPECAADGPRARDRPVPGRRQRREGADHQGRPAELPQGPRERRTRCRRGPAGVGDPGDPRAGLLEVRPRAAPGPAADQEDVGPVPAPLVAERPARHAQRRRRHHRAGRLPQAARHRGQGRQEPLPGHAAGVPGQGRGRRAEEAPGVQLEPEPREGRDHPQGVLQHRHRGRHARRARGPRGQGRRPQGDRRPVPGVHGDLREGPRRQARARTTCRAARSRSPASAGSAAPASPRSSTPPRSRSSVWCARR